METEIPYLDDNPGALRLDAFYARAVSEFDRRYAPGLSEEITSEFVASVVRNATAKLTSDDIADFLSEVPELLAAEAGRYLSREQVRATLSSEAVAMLTNLIANDLQSKLMERAMATMQAA